MTVLSCYTVHKDLDAGHLIAFPLKDLPCDGDMFMVPDGRRVLPLPARLLLNYLEVAAVSPHTSSTPLFTQPAVITRRTSRTVREQGIVSTRPHTLKCDRPWVPTVPNGQVPFRWLRSTSGRGEGRSQSGRGPNVRQVQSLRPETTDNCFALYRQLMDLPSGLSSGSECSSRRSCRR